VDSVAPHERGAASMLKSDAAQGSGSPRHTNTLVGGTCGRSILTRAVTRHCSPAQPPTRCFVQPLWYTTPPEQAHNDALQAVRTYT
jgi:hypothetical protein